MEAWRENTAIVIIVNVNTDLDRTATARGAAVITRSKQCAVHL